MKRLSELKKSLKPIVDELKETTTTDLSEVEYLIDYALKELLYPPKRSAKDRILSRDFGRWQSKIVGPGEKIMHYDDRPCDTEPSDNLIKVDFSRDE
tara:strand:+ start:249 stop:539 length:291 start_codon:yes stop_codon:yes gene_type:complete